MSAALVIELLDFAERLGAEPRRNRRLLVVLTDNIPKHWRWLALHRRLLRVAFFFRPRWLPEARALRVAAEIAAEETATAEYVTHYIFGEFERRFGPIELMVEA